MDQSASLRLSIFHDVSLFLGKLLHARKREWKALTESMSTNCQWSSFFSLYD